jgi:hypothetical protein
MFFMPRSDARLLVDGLNRDIDKLAIGDFVAATTVKRAFAMSFDPEPRADQAARFLINFFNSSTGGPVWTHGFRLILITEFGVWPSTEDLYLHYTIRNSNGNFKQLHEEPGHLFLSHEQPQLYTFLSMFLRFGWGGVMVGNSDLVSAVFTHDQDILLADHGAVSDIETKLRDLQWPYKVLK